jgi:membrane peptidoglycan carboxypeptidase
VIEHVLDELQQRGGGLFTVEDLFQGRIRVRSTIDQRVQKVVNQALENGLAGYEKRHPRARGLTQGSVVVLANADGAILAEAGGRQLYNLRSSRYSGLQPRDRVAAPARIGDEAVRVPGRVSQRLTLDATVPDQPISVPDDSAGDGVKWIANYDARFKGPIPVARRSPSPGTRSRCGSPRPSASRR